MMYSKNTLKANRTWFVNRRVHWGDYQYQGTVTKNFIRNYSLYEAGETYTLEAAEFHTISFAEGTSVLIVEGEPKGLKREVLFPMIDGAGYNPAEGGQFIQKPKRVENFSEMIRPEGILSEIPEVVFVVEIDKIPLSDQFKEMGTERLKEYFVSVPTSDQIKIVTALKDSEHRRSNLRKLLNKENTLGDNAVTVIIGALNIEEIDPSKEFAVLIREVLNCNGFRYDYFQDVFDKLDKSEQTAIVNALQFGSKQRLSDLICDNPFRHESTKELAKSILGHFK